MRHRVSLVLRARELAACVHARKDVQTFEVVGPEEKAAHGGRHRHRVRLVHRCVACGAVRYGRSRRWTRPELVAHVIGATP